MMRTSRSEASTGVGRYRRVRSFSCSSISSTRRDSAPSSVVVEAGAPGRVDEPIEAIGAGEHLERHAVVVRVPDRRLDVEAHEAEARRDRRQQTRPVGRHHGAAQALVLELGPLDRQLARPISSRWRASTSAGNAAAYAAGMASRYSSASAPINARNASALLRNRRRRERSLLRATSRSSSTALARAEALLELHAAGPSARESPNISA